MPAKISLLDLGEIPMAMAQILNVYWEAFSQPPYNRDQADVISFQESFKRHMQRSGFRCMAAWDPDPTRLAGFAYGYSSAPGQWWHELVKSTLQSRLGQEQASFWLGDTFELVELAVRPAWQGQGIGGRLHDLLLEGLPHRTALLSTLKAETSALHLYHKRGWVTLIDEFYYSSIRKPYRIMGFRLQPD